MFVCMYVCVVKFDIGLNLSIKFFSIIWSNESLLIWYIGIILMFLLLHLWIAINIKMLIRIPHSFFSRRTNIIMDSLVWFGLFFMAYQSL